MKQVREWIGGLVGLTLLIALVLALNSLFQAQAEQTGAAASPTLVKQTGATPTSTPRPPLSFESISVARRYALRVEAPVLTGDLDWAPIFSPDGSSMLIQKPISIAEAPCRGWACGIQTRELWRTDLNGRSALFLAKPVIGLPAWSPDNQQIAYIGRSGTGEAFLRVVRADGRGDRLIATDVGSLWPQWLDAQTVVYENVQGRVIAFRLENNTSEYLDPPEVELHRTTSGFAISPRGDRIIFESASEAWLVPLDTRRATALSPYAGALGHVAGGVAWSPDGTQVALASRASIFLADKNGNILTEITPVWLPWWLSWSPDGRLLAFIAQTEDHGDISEIFLMDVAKKQVKQLTNDGKSVYVEMKYTLTWSPDSAKIVYGSEDASGRAQVIELMPNDPQPLGVTFQQEPRSVVPGSMATATPAPPLSDCPYQSGNNGTIWIKRVRYGDGALVQIPFETGTYGPDPTLSNYLGGVLEGELGGTQETPLSDWQSETAHALAVASRTIAVDFCPRTIVTDSTQVHRGLTDYVPAQYNPGHAAARAAEYRTFVADTISQTLIYNGRIFDAQYRTYTGRQTTNRDPNGPHKGIFDPVAAENETPGPGLGQHSANHWAMGQHNARLGQPTDVPNLQWFDYRQILVHYYTGVHIRNVTNNQLLTPNYRWNLLTESIPTTMVGGRFYPVPLVLQNTSSVDWEAHRYVLGYRWDWGPGIYATQTARPAIAIGQWIVTPIPTRVSWGDPYSTFAVT